MTKFSDRDSAGIMQTTKLIGLMLLCSLMVIGCSQAFLPNSANVSSIIIDMPPGWHRLQIYRDGSGAYAFGALAEMGEIAVGTFDFERVQDDLRAGLTRQSQGEGEKATVQFCSQRHECGPLFYFEDRVYIERLLSQGFAQRTGHSILGPGFGLQNLDRIWLERFPE